MIQLFRLCFCLFAAALATGCWYLTGNIAPDFTSKISDIVGPWTGALILVAGLLLWLIDKIFGPLIEHHADNFWHGKNRERLTPNIIARLDKTEAELTTITAIAYAAIAERDEVILENLALKRQRRS